MLPRHHRLRKTTDFKRVYAEGRSHSDSLLALHALRRHDGPSRVGFSISKKLGGAAARNRVRRRVSEQVRHRIARIPDGFDLVFVARRAAAEADSAAIGNSVESLLRRTGVMTPGK